MMFPGRWPTQFLYMIEDFEWGKSKKWNIFLVLHCRSKFKKKTLFIRPIYKVMVFLSAKLALWPSFCRKLKADVLFSFSLFVILVEVNEVEVS